MKLPKYTQAWVDGEGRPHHYFRRPGFPRVPLKGLPWSPQFMTDYEAAMQTQPLHDFGAKRTKPGSLMLLSSPITHHWSFVRWGRAPRKCAVPSWSASAVSMATSR